MHRRDVWGTTSLRLFEKEITINKIKYTFGKFELGAGAFGRVYPARRSTDGLFRSIRKTKEFSIGKILGSQVAVKVVSFVENSSIWPVLTESFLNEIRLSMKLSAESKHVVKMFDFDFNRSGFAFIVMERGEQDLEKALIHRPTIPISQQKTLWKQMINILITLHRHSIVHMDLKPSNLVFFADRLKLVDLGIAQKANTQRQGPNGTYGFSAPEVHLLPRSASVHCTSKADIWSIGAILYWINYGDCPKYDRQRGSYHPPSGLPPVKDSHLIDLFRHTLRFDAHHRPDTNWLSQHPFIRS